MEEKAIFKPVSYICNFYLAILLDSSILFLANG